MIYTLGHKEAYEKAIRDAAPEPIVKLGKGSLDQDGTPLPGGIAFQTIEDALAWNTRKGRPEWVVWGLECDWSNTYLYKDGTYRILSDTPIVPL